MKLSLIPGHETTSKVQFNWKATTVEKLQQYLGFYKSVTGADVPLKDLTEQMLLDFMAEDKAFQKFVKSQEPQASVGQQAPRQATHHSSVDAAGSAEIG